MGGHPKRLARAGTGMLTLTQSVVHCLPGRLQSGRGTHRSPSGRWRELQDFVAHACGFLHPQVAVWQHLPTATATLNCDCSCIQGMRRQASGNGYTVPGRRTGGKWWLTDGWVIWPMSCNTLGKCTSVPAGKIARQCLSMLHLLLGTVFVSSSLSPYHLYQQSICALTVFLAAPLR